MPQRLCKGHAVKRKRRRKPYNQPVIVNLFLFFLSVTALIGAALLFNHALNSPGIPLRLGSYGKASVGVDKVFEHNKAIRNAPPSNNVSDKGISKAGKYEYSFYDILAREHKFSSSNNYCIQIAALKNRTSARAIVRRLKKKHLHATIRKQGGWYLVQWGSFPTRKAAERYKKELSKFLKRECIVVRIL